MADGKWQRAKGRGPSAEDEGQRTKATARNEATARRAERTEGTGWFTSWSPGLRGRGTGRRGGHGAKQTHFGRRAGPRRSLFRRRCGAKTNPIRPRPGAPHEPDAPARDGAKDTGPLAVRNEPTGALGGLGSSCCHVLKIRNEPNVTPGDVGKFCRSAPKRPRRRRWPRAGSRRRQNKPHPRRVSGVSGGGPGNGWGAESARETRPLRPEAARNEPTERAGRRRRGTNRRSGFVHVGGRADPGALGAKQSHFGPARRRRGTSRRASGSRPLSRRRGRGRGSAGWGKVAGRGRPSWPSRGARASSSSGRGRGSRRGRRRG
jgi:hypothetical protein